MEEEEVEVEELPDLDTKAARQKLERQLCVAFHTRFNFRSGRRGGRVRMQAVGTRRTAPGTCI